MKYNIDQMANLSKYWKILVENWDTIEEKYNQDYEKYGNMAYDEGELNKYIESLF